MGSITEDFKSHIAMPDGVFNAPTKTPVLSTMSMSPSDVDGGYSIRETLMGSKRPIKVIFMGMGASGINFCRTIAKMYGEH